MKAPSRLDGYRLTLASLLLCFGVWRWAGQVLVPANTISAQHRGVPIGNNSDLYPRWLGSRELLLHHRDPYSAGVTGDIQKGFYGRQLDPAKASDPSDQAAFAYPIYVAFVLAPTVTLPFGVVSGVMRWLFMVCIAVSVPIWAYAIGLRVKAAWVITAMALTLSAYASVLEFHMQNLSALVAILLASASASLACGWLTLAGILLAISTIKPQFSGIFVLWFLIWSAGRWRERRRLVFAFGMTMLVLIVGGEAILPGWIKEFVVATRNYRVYTMGPTALGMFFPPLVSRIIGAVLVFAVLALGWQRKISAGGSDDFAWMLAWSASVTVMLVPISLYNQVLLIPSLLMLLKEQMSGSGRGTLSRALFKAVFACLVWQWATAAALGFASYVVAAERLRSVAYLPMYTSLALPAIVLLAVASFTLNTLERRRHTELAGLRTAKLYD